MGFLGGLKGLLNRSPSFDAFELPPGPTVPRPLPAPGRLSLQVTHGGEPLTVEGTFDFCPPAGVDGFELRAFGQLPDGRRWSVTARPEHQVRLLRGGLRTWPPYFEVSLGGERFTATAGRGAPFTYADGVFKIWRDLYRSRDDGREDDDTDDPRDVMRVNGELVCPNEPKAPIVGRDLLEAIAAVAGPRVRPWITQERGRQRRFVGASVIVPTDTHESLRAKLREALGPTWQVFRSTPYFLPDSTSFENGKANHHVPPWWTGDERWAISEGVRAAELAVIAGAPVDVLRAAWSPHCAGSPDPSVAHRQVRHWDERYGVDVLEADESSLSLRFLRPPEDRAALVAEMSAFSLRSWSDDDPLRRALEQRAPLSFSWAT